MSQAKLKDINASIQQLNFVFGTGVFLHRWKACDISAIRQLRYEDFILSLLFAVTDESLIRYDGRAADRELRLSARCLWQTGAGHWLATADPDPHCSRNDAMLSCFIHDTQITIPNGKC